MRLLEAKFYGNVIINLYILFLNNVISQDDKIKFSCLTLKKNYKLKFVGGGSVKLNLVNIGHLKNDLVDFVQI